MRASKKTCIYAAGTHLNFPLRVVSNHVALTVTEWVALRTLWPQDETTDAKLIQALGRTKG